MILPNICTILGERKYARRRPLWELIPIDLFREIIASIIISSSHERSLGHEGSFGHETRTFVEDTYFVEVTRLHVESKTNSSPILHTCKARCI
jgi:hypothetical protein